MKAILDHCVGVGGRQKAIPAGDLIIREGGATGRLYVLIEGSVEVVKGDVVVAAIAEPGAIFGEMAVLLNQGHSAGVRAASASTVYEIDDAAAFMRGRPEVALLVAQLLARRLYVATTYLADLRRQYAGHGNHLAMVSDLLQSMINLGPTEVAPGSDLQSDPRI
jgi:CRP/FNR family transcriptional regulator, cyclic AMP receptor protein